MKNVILSLFAISLVSCSSASIKTVETNKLYEVLSQESYGGASIRFFEILSLPEEIKMLQQDENLKNKISPTDIQKSNFIILNMGEKASGGYSIGIDNVVETEKNIVVTVKENVPATGSMVTQALTNPFCVVKINSKKEIIIK
ncbi:protease complex subunit PrcB family protein [Flavobacterium weaverense]|uniref:Protease stability complex PrcB-like protein n=1 Tax=Flavobacterium weaverense TaxID=271156 RepID=A0A3L9ZUJ9_9FLAO|nr:protease complex subunit PrcB family protein [Flavobacterium weaverense]RMA76076.1 protease stability complex PrcB-like protein [Flavobacterium weaverense]